MSQQPPYNPSSPPGGYVPPETKNYGEAPPPYPGTGGTTYPTTGGVGPYPTAAPISYGMTTTTTTVPAMATTTVVMTGNCPRCHVGNLIEQSNTGALVCIIILVILFFPIGLLYLLCLPGAVEHRCPHCGYCTD